MGAVVSAYEDPLLIMEYMDYGSLSDMLQNGTLLLEAEIILPMLQDITSGCRFLHATNVVHGDLKAANILVDSKFRAEKCLAGKTGDSLLHVAARLGALQPLKTMHRCARVR